MNFDRKANIDRLKSEQFDVLVIGGGIAGDFPICVVPMLHQDLQRTGVPLPSLHSSKFALLPEPAIKTGVTALTAAASARAAPRTGLRPPGRRMSRTMMTSAAAIPEIGRAHV